MLCFRGWTFAQDRDGLTLQAPGGSIAVEVTLYGNVPWLRLHPSSKAGVASSGNLSLTSVVVAPVTKHTEAELALHRLQGHTPFHPGCKHCQVARSVHQHRKRDKGRLESEVVADFFFLTTTGEDLRADRLVNYLKVLVLVERMSSMIGAVVVSSNVVQTRSGIVSWLKEFGLTSGTCSVRLLTDAEGAVADLVGTASGAFTFQIKRAEPQNHEAVGSAERGVRRLKEAFQTLRSDLNVEGLDVCFTADGLSCVLTYLCFSLNKFGKAHGSDLAPCDFVLGRPSPKGAFTLFGSTVLAELPQSVRDLAPNLPRFVESCFLHPVFDSMAIKVRALVRIEGELVLKTFSATSVKPCVPLSWKLELLDGVLNTLGGGPGLPMPNEERVVLEPPVSTQVPSSGPPVEFVKNHGYTAGCTACSNIESGKKGSRVHNQTCRRRYALWLSEQLTLDGAGVVLEPNPVEQQGPQEPSAGSGVPRGEHGRRLVDDVPGDLVSGGRERVEADVAMGSSGDAQFVEPPVALPPEGTSHRAGEPVAGSSEQLREEGEQAAKRVRTTPPVPQDPPSLLKRNPRRVSSDVPVSLSPGVVQESLRKRG